MDSPLQVRSCVCERDRIAIICERTWSCRSRPSFPQSICDRLRSMRAGLIAAGALALAFFVVETAQAQAPVPCSHAGGGHYNCNWWPPGNGPSGGALVVVDTTTVGYLHQGSNWIICQQKGGSVYNSRGYKNLRLGYTQADNDKWGWASAIEGPGGAACGRAGGGVPSCSGERCSPPAYAGEWGAPPAPGGFPPTP